MSGKGDSPRNCFSEAFRDGYDAIDWSVKPARKGLTTLTKPATLPTYDDLHSLSQRVIPATSNVLSHE